MKKKAALKTSLYRNLQPQIKVTFPRGTLQRDVNAAIFRLAADIEEASKGQKWVVTPWLKDRIIYLELYLATEKEAKLGLEVLRRFCS